MSYNLDAVPILPPIQSSDYFNPQPEWKKSIASHLDELQALGGGALGMAGTALGIEGLQKAGQEIYDRNMEESQAGWQRPAVPRVEDVRFSEPGGAGRALDFAMYQGPKALAIIGESLLGGLGGGAIAKGLAKRGLSETAGDAAKQVLERQWMKGAAAGSLGTNAAMESSQAFGQMVQDGATPEDSLLPALAYGAASSATEVVPGYLMAKHMGWLEPFKDKVRKEILGDAALSGAAVKLAQSKLGKFTKGVVAGGAAEGLQEGTQQLLQIAAERVAKGDPMFADLSDEDKSQVLNSAVVGMLGGGLVGGPVGLMGGHGSTTQPKEQGSRALTPSVIAGSQAPEAEPVEEKKQWNYGPHNGSDPRGFDPNWKFNTGPSGMGVYGEAPLEGEVIDGQRREPQRRLPWPAIDGEVVPNPTQIGEVPLSGDVVNGPERQKQRALPWPPIEGEVVDQQAIEQQRKLTGTRQLGAPSIVTQLARTTETPHLDEAIDPNEWDQAFGTELVPENEIDFWRRMGEDLPGPVVRADGKPYVTQKSAEAAARRNGADGPAIKIKGGFAVQPWTTPPVRPLSDKAQLNPTEPLGRIEQDPRLQDPEVRARMRQLADQTGWEQEGGRIIRDASGKVVDRTKWLPKQDWWIDRPRDVKPHHVRSGMAKIEKGEPLQTRERRAVAWLASMASADLHEENPAKWGLGAPTNVQQEPQVASPDRGRAPGEVEPNPFEGGSEFKFGKNAPKDGLIIGFNSDDKPVMTETNPEKSEVFRVVTKKHGETPVYANPTIHDINWLRESAREEGKPDEIRITVSKKTRKIEYAWKGADAFHLEMESLISKQGRQEPSLARYILNTQNKLFGNLSDKGRTESPVQNPTTRERLESVLHDLIGRSSHWRVHIHESAPKGTDSSTYGWVQKENGKYHVHFILDRIEQGTELSKFLHEVGGHLGIDGLLAPGERKRLVDAIRRWTSADGMEGDIARAAQRRVEAAGTPVADQDSELIAYFLEEAVQRGVTPTAKGGLGDWFRTLWAAFKRALRKLGLHNVDQLTPQHVVDLAYGAAKLELAERMPEGAMGSEGIRYGKLYTAPTVGPDANLNPPSYVNKILYDYTNGLADLKKLHPKLESLINRVASKRGSVLEHYHHDKVKPFTDKMADYKNLTGKSDEEVNLEFAARHVATDGENHLMALREVKHTAIEFEKVLRGIWKGMDQANPMQAELGTLIREFTKGRANLMKGWPWGWVVTAQMRRNRNIQPVNHLTNRQVQEKLVEKLESLLNTQLSNGNELWTNFDNIKDMRMEWEALRNHGAGLQTKGTMSQRPSVRTAFEQWMGPQRMAELTRLDADTIWARVQSQQHSAEFLDLARRLDEVAADIRDQRVRGRLSTPEQATAMATDHPHWVPLRRESYDFEDVFGGSGASNRRMKARFGTPKIDPPVHVYQNAFAALDLTVTAAEANLARIELADTLRADPSLLEGWFEEPTSLPESQKRYDKQGFAQYTWKPHDKYSIPFLVDGDPWVIPIVKSNERAQVVSAAIQNLAPMDQRAVMTLFKNANKFLRWVIISANPAFTLTNAPKDFGHAMMTIQAGPLARYSKEIAASYKDCFMELWRHFVLKQPSQTILDMEKAGGRITFIESLRPNDRGFGSVEKSVAWAQGGKVLRPEMARGLRDFLHMIEDVNIAVESVMRLAVWKAGKRHQAAFGVTDDELGSLCKDVTVNYDRRGLRSHIVNAFYMFFNASVQGVSGVLDAAANGSNRVRFFKAIGGVMTAALLADLVGAAISPGWDDTPEDQKDRFARIPGSNLVLPGDTMAKVPLPWVFNVVWRAGEMLGEMVRGRLSPNRYVAKLLELTINSTNPIGGSVQVAGAEGSDKDFDFGAPSVMTMLTPSALDWFTQIQTNRDPFGRPMGPEKLPGEKYKPESEMSWDSTPKFYKWVARELNAWTGGSQGESGLLDWRPSTYKTLVDTLGGGLGQVMTGLAGTAWGVVAGNPPSINRVPGAKSFFFTPSGQVGSGLYHERVARVEQARAGTKALEGLGASGRPDLEALRTSRAIELRMAPALDDTERQITDLRKQMKEAMKRGQDSRVEVLKGRIKLAQERFNRVWERRSGG